jgi:hypothetical protein
MLKNGMASYQVQVKLGKGFKHRRVNMFFGATSFAAAPFAGVGITNIVVNATGNQLNIAIGNTNVGLVTTVPVTGNKFNLATNTVNVINWNQYHPGCNRYLDPNRSRPIGE